MIFSRNSQETHEKEVAKFIKNILGFRPKNVSFYNTALIHRSASNSAIDGHLINNERLEYLGDAVLDTIVAEYLFKKFPLKPEGELTEMRSKLVCREQLGKLSHKMHLEDLITKQRHVTTRFAGGDAFEALVGAMFLDKGYEKTKKIVLHNIFFSYLDVDALLAEETNFKSKILMWAQRNHKQLDFEHEVVEEHNRRRLYRVKLLVDEAVFAEGLDYTVKKAEQIAAERALEKLFAKEEA